MDSVTLLVVSGEKSRIADALAYYFALTEKTSEISLE